MKRRILVVAGLAVGVGAVLALAADQPGRDRAPGPGGRPFEALGLTDAQRTELRKLGSDHRKAMIRSRADMQVARLDLHDLLMAPNPDERAINAKVKELSDLQAAALRVHVDGRLALRKVLTPEQLEKFRQMQAHRFARARHRRFGGGPGMRHGDGPRRGGPPEGGPRGGRPPAPEQPIR